MHMHQIIAHPFPSLGHVNSVQMLLQYLQTAGPGPDLQHSLQQQDQNDQLCDARCEAQTKSCKVQQLSTSFE